MQGTVVSGVGHSRESHGSLWGVGHSRESLEVVSAGEEQAGIIADIKI